MNKTVREFVLSTFELNKRTQCRNKICAVFLRVVINRLKVIETGIRCMFISN